MSNNQDQINSKDFLIGTLIGGIVGASVALLLAPKSGKELRTNLNEQALIAKEKGSQIAESAKIKTQGLIEKVKSANSNCCQSCENNDEELDDLLAENNDIVADKSEIVADASEEVAASEVVEEASENKVE